MNNMIWVWLGAVIVFGVAEGVTAGLVSIWFVAGAVAALIAAVAGASVTVQGILFVAVSAVSGRHAGRHPVPLWFGSWQNRPRPHHQRRDRGSGGAEAKVTSSSTMREFRRRRVYVYGKDLDRPSTGRQGRQFP